MTAAQLKHEITTLLDNLPEPKLTVIYDFVKFLAEREPDPDQQWYWTPGWQAQEQEAEEDLRLGRYQDFGTMDEFIDSLRSLLANE
jgi:hypothetical protein